MMLYCGRALGPRCSDPDVLIPMAPASGRNEGPASIMSGIHSPAGGAEHHNFGPGL